MDFLVPLSGSTNMNIASLVSKSQPTAVKRVKVFQKTILLCSWVFCFCLLTQLMEQKIQNLQKWMQHLLNGFTAIVVREDISAPKLVGVVWITKSPTELVLSGLGAWYGDPHLVLVLNHQNLRSSKFSLDGRSSALWNIAVTQLLWASGGFFAKLVAG